MIESVAVGLSAFRGVARRIVIDVESGGRVMVRVQGMTGEGWQTLGISEVSTMVPVDSAGANVGEYEERINLEDNGNEGSWFGGTD